MPESLVDSQFAILEEPDVCITLEETLIPEVVTSHLTSIFKNNRCMSERTKCNLMRKPQFKHPRSV